LFLGKPFFFLGVTKNSRFESLRFNETLRRRGAKVKRFRGLEVEKFRSLEV